MMISSEIVVFKNICAESNNLGNWEIRIPPKGEKY
jgi:hypothetical protein